MVDRITEARAAEIQKEREGRIDRLIKTLEAGQDQDAERFRKVERLNKERVAIEKKEDKFEDLGKKLWQSTLGSLFGGMGQAIPEPIKILGRMAGVATGARGRLQRKRERLLQKAYKRADEVGMDRGEVATASSDTLEGMVAGPTASKALMTRGSQDFILVHDKKLYELMEKLFKGPTAAQKREEEVESRRKGVWGSMLGGMKGSGSKVSEGLTKKISWKSILVGLAALAAGLGIGKILSMEQVKVAIESVKEWIKEQWPQWKETLKQTLTDSFGINGETLRLSALKIGMGTGAFTGAMLGLSMGGVLGGLIGAIVGAGVAAVAFYTVTNTWDKFHEDAGKAIDSIVGTKKKDWMVGGATLGAALGLAAGVAAMTLGAPVSVPVAIAMLLGATALGALSAAEFHERRHGEFSIDETNKNVLAKAARDAKKSWLTRNIIIPLSNFWNWDPSFLGGPQGSMSQQAANRWMTGELADFDHEDLRAGGKGLSDWAVWQLNQQRKFDQKFEKFKEAALNFREKLGEFWEAIIPDWMNLNFVITIPDMNIPDMQMIANHVAQKFKTTVAESLDVLPDVVLPQSVENWIETQLLKGTQGKGGVSMSGVDYGKFARDRLRDMKADYRSYYEGGEFGAKGGHIPINPEGRVPGQRNNWGMSSIPLMLKDYGTMEADWDPNTGLRTMLAQQYSTGKEAGVRPTFPNMLRYIKSKGLSHIHAMGMVANIMAESSMNPAAVNFNEDGSMGAVGLFQFRGGRKTRFLSQVKDWKTNWKAQIDYALNEPDRDSRLSTYLGTSYATPGLAAEGFNKTFERAGAEHNEKRNKIATDMASELKIGSPSFQHWDSGGGQGRPKSDYMIEGWLNRAMQSVNIIDASTTSNSAQTTTVENPPDFAVIYHPRWNVSGRSWWSTVAR